MNATRLRGRPASPRLRRARGFTLIETMVTVGIAGVLSSMAYPNLESQVLRARRSDGLVAILQAQLAEERYRANNATYGSLAQAGLRGNSGAGLYALEVTLHSADGYVILASAVGAQARDASCRHLRLTLADASLSYASGADATTANGASANRRCWSR